MPELDEADVSPRSATDLLPWEDKQRFRKIFRTQASRSYLHLSLGMGLLAFSLPLVMIALGGYGQHYSISHYYHDPRTRDVLVGFLCGVGAFLMLFQGLSRIENWLLNIAGGAVVTVAFVPMAQDQCAKGASIHGLAAATFFLCLSVVAAFLSKKRLEYIIYPPMRARFARAYSICGIAMLTIPGTIMAMHFLRPESCHNLDIFWAETLGIWSFAAYWFWKTYEYRKLLGIR